VRPLLRLTPLADTKRSRDSMGIQILRRGDIQLTSAGTGIRHSEHAHGVAPVHFLQIWALPHTRGLAPKYFTRHATDTDKADKWALVVAPGVRETREGDGPTPVQSPVAMRAAILSAGTRLEHTLPATPGARKAYVHAIQRSGYNPGKASGARIRVSGQGADTVLAEGDGAYLTGAAAAALAVENVGDVSAEVVLFDIDF
jgi:redox-sensitive bicupin YhaK (pirin superfamily)